MSPPEIRLPELDGKTPKMYRGGKICCDVHFNPLWAKHAPSYGIAHAMALGVHFDSHPSRVVSSVAGRGDPALGGVRLAVVCLMKQANQVTVPSRPCPSSSSSLRSTAEVPPSFARRPRHRACADCRLWRTTSAWDTRRSGNAPSSHSPPSPTPNTGYSPTFSSANTTSLEDSFAASSYRWSLFCAPTKTGANVSQ